VLQPIVSQLQLGIAASGDGIHSDGSAMVILAVFVKLLFWPWNPRSIEASLRIRNVAPNRKGERCGAATGSA
jgi:hypothetical protein